MHEQDRRNLSSGQAKRLAMEAVERAVKQLDDNQSDEAIDSLTLAIGLCPALANAYCARAGALDERGDFELAVADCTEVIRLDPECAEAYSLRGQIYERMGDWARAERDVSHARRIEASRQ